MAEAITVHDIVEQYLKANGYDGLLQMDRECACFIGDLAPCDDQVMSCEPGYAVPCVPEECDQGGCDSQHISVQKPAQKEAAND